MRTWATSLGVIALMTLARPAAAQFTTTIGSTMKGANSTSGTSTSFFSTLMAKPNMSALTTRTSAPTSNFLGMFPQLPSARNTMMMQLTPGTTPQATVTSPQLPTRQVPPPPKKSLLSKITGQ